MSETNKEIVGKANALLTAGDTEGFLKFFTKDIKWTLLAGTPKVYKGIDAVSGFMQESTKEGVTPPVFTELNLLAEGDTVIANGTTSMMGKDGKAVPYAYCDVYQFRDGLIAELTTFMAQTEAEPTERTATA
jgi:ketosteroid isomerase-like protein